MIAHDGKRLMFEHQLRIEAERVLDDVVFQRSPVQSRLLRYLVEREANGLPAPTQYEIAVDGLGKDSDFDLSSDSYPRVQISRLRKNLEDYYARNLPGAGLRLALHSTAYRLRLVPDGRAAGHGTADEGAQDAPQGRPEPRDHSGQSRGFAIPGWGRSAWIIAAVLGAALVFFALARSDLSPAPAAGAMQPPQVALEVLVARGPKNEDLKRTLASNTRQNAEMHLAYSFVSRFQGRTADPDGPVAYALNIRIGEGVRDDLVALLTLRKSNGKIAFANTIVYDFDEPDRFMAELEATLVYMTSPNGIIAASEKRGITDPLQSDYACFLSIEDRRSSGVEAARLVDDCLTKFADSEFGAFWYARRAFTGFQQDIMAGRLPDKRSESWEDVQNAFEVDRYNAFANFVAAKVELANGRCDDAITYIEQALERGSSYPTLIAAMEIDAAQCLESTQDAVFDIGMVRSLARYNPSPDPLLHLYLMVSTLATEDIELARQVARRRYIENPQTPVEITSDMLRRALTEPGYASANRDELKRSLAAFVWNEGAVDQLLDRLTD